MNIPRMDIYRFEENGKRKVVPYQLKQRKKEKHFEPRKNQICKWEVFPPFKEAMFEREVEGNEQ